MQEIQENIARKLRATMEYQQKTIAGLAEELGISQTSLKNYIKGVANPRADTIDLLAARLDLTPAELISDLPSGAIQAELVFRAAREVGELSPEQREEGVRLFLSLVDLFSTQKEADHRGDRPE